MGSIAIFAILPSLFLKLSKDCYTDFMHPILKAHIEKKEFHHAYLLCGEVEVCKKMAEDMAKVILAEDNLQSHPDFSYSKFGLFGIDDSHNLANRAWKKIFLGNEKSFHNGIFSFNMESSNALLKLLEEPVEKTYFFSLFPPLTLLFRHLDQDLLLLVIFQKIKEPDENFLKSAKIFKFFAEQKTGNGKKDVPRKGEGDELLEDTSINKQKAVKLLNSLEFLLERELRTPEKEKKSESGS